MVLILIRFVLKTKNRKDYTEPLPEALNSSGKNAGSSGSEEAMSDDDSGATVVDESTAANPAESGTTTTNNSELTATLGEHDTPYIPIP